MSGIVFASSSPTPWTVAPRLINFAINGDSKPANGFANVKTVSTNTTQVQQRSYSGFLSMMLGTNYNAPWQYAVGGTTLETDLTFVTDPNAPGGTSGGPFLGVAMNGLSPPADLILVDSGTNNSTDSLGTLESKSTDLITATQACSGLPSTHVWDMAIPPVGLNGSVQFDNTKRLALNAYKAGTLDPSFGDRVRTVNIDSIVQDPANPGCLLPAYTIDGIHLNATGGIAVAQYISSGAGPVLPAPVIYPYALNAASDPTNLLSWLGSSSIGAPLNRWAMLGTGGTSSNLQAGSTIPTGWSITAATDWTVTGTGYSAKPAASLTSLGAINRMALTIPVGTLSASTGFSDSSITISAGTITSTLNLINIGDVVRAGMLLELISCPNIVSIRYRCVYSAGGISYTRQIIGNDDDTYILPPNLSIPWMQPDFTALASPVSVTTFQIIIQWRTGSATSGQIRLSSPFMRKINYLTQWP